MNNITIDDAEDFCCDVCDAEFSVTSTDSEAQVDFCPFCGSEIGDDDIHLEDDEEGHYD